MDDAAIVAPDNWSGKNEYIDKQWNAKNSIVAFPPRKQFYCTERRAEVALLSLDNYFTTGLRFLLEGMNDMILHIYKTHSEFYKASARSIDATILSASDAKDIVLIYRVILQLRMNGQNAFILVVANDDLSHELRNITRRHSAVKVLSSRAKLSVLKKELMKLLTEHEIKKQNQYFPSTLTARQADILLMAANGLSAEDIAFRTGVSKSTIYTTKARALDKAGATNKALEAILYAQIKDGLLNSDLH